MLINISSLDCVFLTYNEPNADENWAKISAMVPWAVRVDGVKGFDAAHKAAASASNTERFVLIDGDTLPNMEFFNGLLFIAPGRENYTFRWKSKNSVNGLVYGNGGISSWTKSYIDQMRSHEASDSSSTMIDFCWEDGYLSMHDCYGTTHINRSSYQAFRAGYREGVKLTTDRGIPHTAASFSQAHPLNTTRLLQWMTIGKDVAYGDYAMVGARVGFAHTLKSMASDINDNDAMVAVYDSFSEDCDRTISTMETTSLEMVRQLGVMIDPFSSEQSKLVKRFTPDPVNIGMHVTEAEFNASLAKGFDYDK